MIINIIASICMFIWTVVIGWSLSFGLGVDAFIFLTLIYGGLYLGARHLLLEEAN